MFVNLDSLKILVESLEARDLDLASNHIRYAVMELEGDTRGDYAEIECLRVVADCLQVEGNDAGAQAVRQAITGLLAARHPAGLPDPSPPRSAP